MMPQHLASYTDPISLILVALSLLIAVIASYSAVDLAGRVAASRGSARLAWLLGGALVFGGGIWAMHFTAMLAHPFPVAVGYDLGTVALSLLIAVVIAVPALYLSGGTSLTLPRLLGGGLLVGIGIIAMHYTGMEALRRVRLSYDPWLVMLSVLIAIGAGTLALRAAFALRDTTGTPALRRKVGAALLLGVAIVGMHYSGMAATSFTPTAEGDGGVLQTNVLSLGVSIAVVTILTLGLTLIVGLLDRRLGQQSRARSRAEAQYQSLFRYHPDAIIALNFDGICQSLNPAAAALLGRDPILLQGQNLLELAPASEQARIQQALADIRSGADAVGILDWPDATGVVRSLQVTYVPIVVDSERIGVFLIAHDDTQRHSAESARRESLAQLSAALASQQQLRDTISAMDMPILPVAEGVLVVPLIGSLDSERSEQLLMRTLAQVEQRRTKTVILDVTGVPLIDTLAAAGIMQLSQALRLLGTRCIVVGLGPEIVQTLVQLGADLSTLETRRDLQDGIRLALQQRWADRAAAAR